MDIQLEEIGKRVKEARKAKGLTQVQLAEMVGISSIYLSNIERGKKQMTIKTVIAISDALNVTTDWLLKNDSHQKEQAIANKIIDGLAECSDEDKDFAIRLNQAMFTALRDIRNHPSDT